MPRNLDPGHEERRQFLRIAGFALAGIGAVLTLIGIGSFFSTFIQATQFTSGFGATPEPPRYFWCAFLGLPMLGVGLSLLQFGYFGAVARYMAGEAAPVGKDVANYMATETREATETVARSLARGVREGMAPPEGKLSCPRCGAANDADARFCRSCGDELHPPRTCPACGAEAAPGARFCDQCGKRL